MTCDYLPARHWHGRTATLGQLREWVANLDPALDHLPVVFNGLRDSGAVRSIGLYTFRQGTEASIDLNEDP